MTQQPRGAPARRTQAVLGADDVRRAITRMAHEIIERNRGLDGVVLHRPPARRRVAGRALGAEIARIERAGARSGRSTPRLYRDDIGLRPVVPGRSQRHPGRRSTARPWCSSTTCCSPAAPCGPRSTPSPTTAGRGPCSWPCSSTAATASCRSGPTSSARTCRRALDEDVQVDRRRRGDRRMARREAPALDRRARPRRRAPPARPHRPHGRGQPAPEPEGAGAARQDRRATCSSRTRPAPGCRFETAAKRLSADTMTFSVGTSSVNKGESLRDTIETIAAMGVDAFVDPPQVERRAVAGQPAGRTASIDQRRRRLARPPDPGAARRLHGPHRARPHRRASTACTSRSSATSSTAGSPAATSRRSRMLGADVTLVAPPHAAAAGRSTAADRPTTSTP